jgi:hypothetical protein
MSAINGEAKHRVTFFKGTVAFIERRCDPFPAGPQDQIVCLGLPGPLNVSNFTYSVKRYVNDMQTTWHMQAICKLENKCVNDMYTLCARCAT